VAGGTGSGKSTLVCRLQETFAPHEVITLCHDYYYRGFTGLTYDERSKLNYDHPDSFETELMVTHIRALRDGQTVRRPVYSFTDHNRLPETIEVVPARVLIVDGILIFEDEELRKLMDVKVFVDTDADLRLARRLMRDVRERGRSVESVLDQYVNTVKPMHDEFVEPSKRHADVIIPECGFNSVAVGMLIENIKSLIQSMS
jgi:uridine kinase